MLTKDQFNILMAYKNSTSLTQRTLANKLNLSLESINYNLKQLENSNLIFNNKLTNLANEELKKFKVDNAIIMAAGISSRFAPLSYEKPKGLLEVKGEILIERQIKQLKEAGIDDITIVVGYKKEMFFYLEKKFNVNIVVNNDYYRYNNVSTLMLVKNKLKNTFICSSDNYFINNVFEKNIYQSYYSAIYSEDYVNEYCLNFTDEGLIENVIIGGDKSWFMFGHVYFSEEFSKKFISVLEEEYVHEESRLLLWEDIYIKHITELDMFIRKYNSDEIKEFDSLDELRLFDKKYVNNTKSNIIKNICKVLKCDEKDINNITPLKNGLTNLSFVFECNNKKYVYRHPGDGTSSYINRKSEAFSTNIAKKLGIDNTFIYMNENEGWKISQFVEDAHILDYHNSEEVTLALNCIRKLHNFKIISNYKFDMWEKILHFTELTKSLENINELASYAYEVEYLHNHLKKDSYETCLCHCDCFDANFLINYNKDISLIDWEFSGMSDPGVDLGTFICCSNYTYEESIKIIEEYLQHTPSKRELAHFLGYIALCSYYWYLWALHQESMGTVVDDFLYLWKKYYKYYSKKALSLYKEIRN